MRYRVIETEGNRGPAKGADSLVRKDAPREWQGLSVGAREGDRNIIRDSCKYKSSHDA